VVVGEDVVALVEVVGLGVVVFGRVAHGYPPPFGGKVFKADRLSPDLVAHVCVHDCPDKEKPRRWPGLLRVCSGGAISILESERELIGTLGGRFIRFVLWGMWGVFDWEGLDRNF